MYNIIIAYKTIAKSDMLVKWTQPKNQMAATYAISFLHKHYQKNFHYTQNQL